MPDLSIQTLDPRMLSSLARSSSAIEQLKPARAGQTGLEKANVDALLGEFQNVMFTEMMKAMRATVPESELFGRNTGREIFESFLDEKYAAATGSSLGSLGLTEALRRQLGLDEAVPMEPAVPAVPPARTAGPAPGSVSSARPEDDPFRSVAERLPGPALLVKPAVPEQAELPQRFE